MAPKSKWIAGLDADRPVSEAARQALSLRLKAVRRWLVLAADDEGGRPEAVHQLRVASRRAAAALSVFGDLLPRRRARRLRRRLKAVRAAAGEARDLDVMLARLKERAAQDKSQQPIIELIRRERRAAQPAIEAARRKLRRKHFRQQAAQLISRARYRGAANNGHEPSLRRAAQAMYPALCADFLAAAAGDLSAVENLHALRISGKRLRYAMELFARAYGADFRETTYAAVEDLQQRLGDINDHAAARDRFIGLEQKASPKERALLKKLAAREAAALEKCRGEFLAWWTPRRQRQFRKLLLGHAARGENDAAHSARPRGGKGRVR